MGGGIAGRVGSCGCVERHQCFGRLLGPRIVNTVCFRGENLPEPLVRRPSACSLVDIAVGSKFGGNDEVPTRVSQGKRHAEDVEVFNLKMAISTGNLELLRMSRECLLEASFEFVLSCWRERASSTRVRCWCDCCEDFDARVFANESFCGFPYSNGRGQTCCRWHSRTVVALGCTARARVR
jgi:hypothetical protein